MRSVNKVILIGNLTRDPELKTTQNGQPVCTFGMATNREWMTKDSQKRSLAEFHNVAAWGKLAEICQKFLKKGKLVYVEGYLKTRSWDSAQGVRIFKTEIVIYDMIMLDKRPSDYSPEMDDHSYARGQAVEDDIDAVTQSSDQGSDSFEYSDEPPYSDDEGDMDSADAEASKMTGDSLL